MHKLLSGGGSIIVIILGQQTVISHVIYINIIPRAPIVGLKGGTVRIVAAVHSCTKGDGLTNRHVLIWLKKAFPSTLH